MSGEGFSIKDLYKKNYVQYFIQSQFSADTLRSLYGYDELYGSIKGLKVSDYNRYMNIGEKLMDALRTDIIHDRTLLGVKEHDFDMYDKAMTSMERFLNLRSCSSILTPLLRAVSFIHWGHSTTSSACVWL